MKYQNLVGVIMVAGLFFAYSCKDAAKGSFRITGTYKNAGILKGASAPTKVYLQEVSFGKDQAPVFLDSARLSGNSGNFSVRTTARIQGIYELVFNENIAVPLINDASEIKVDVDLAKRDNYYEVSGSQASRQLKELITGFGEKSFQVEKSFAELDSLKRINAADSQVIAATGIKNKTIEDLNNYLKHFLKTITNPTLGVLALGWSSASLPRADFEMELNNLLKKYPDNSLIQNMKKTRDLQQAEMERRQQDHGWTGKQVPELALPDTVGKSIALSSFKGKWVLVDFWASWCGPCRQENPNVVKVFQEYKNKNFTILGVSLDKEKNPWKEAIRQDHLAWTQVSDLKFWNSKAVEIFGFEGIPFNILVDPKGKVVAQELRGQDLENKLSEVLK